MAIRAILLSVLSAAVVQGWGDVAPPPPAAPAAQYIPFNDEQTVIFLEGENFTASGGWEAREWAKSPHYFASTVANVFHSRRAYLHGPENVTQEDGASATFIVPESKTPQTYSVLVRYEAPYRFEVPFQLDITQGGAKKYTRVYGRRSNLKVWGFSYSRSRGSLCGPGLQTECAWPWGATENMVWEGVNTSVTGLEPGKPAVITLTPIHDSDYCCWGDRNIDVVMLHPNSSDVNARLESVADGQVLPLDGLFSQQNEVFFKVQNMNTTHNLSVTVPLTYDHDPYMGQHDWLNKTTAYITVPPGKTTGWVEVGGLMSTFNHGSWKVSCDALAFPPPPPPNETKCEIDIQQKCDNSNKTTCLACAAKMVCPQPCLDVKGNCTTAWIAAACTPPPPPPPAQELECIAIVEKTCAQNHTGGQPIAKNQSLCMHCASNISPCPKVCEMPGPKNTTVCQKAWLEKGCQEMIPPRPPPPPPRPHPPVTVGPAHCVITVGVLADPFATRATTTASSSASGGGDGRVTIRTDAPGVEVVPVNGGVFDSVQTGTEILFDASTRASRRVRHNEDDFLEIWAQLEAQGKVPGSPPKLVPIYGATFPNGSDSGSSGDGPAREDYATKQQQFVADFCDPLNSCLCTDKCNTGKGNSLYADIRETNITRLVEQDPSAAQRVTTVSMGDEISVTAKGNDSTFVAWCQQEKMQPKDVGCSGWSTCHFMPSILNGTTAPLTFYWSSKFIHSAGIAAMKAKIAKLQALLPKAKIGANFSPTGYFTDPRDGKQKCQNYLGFAFQWVRLFREQGLTLPWGEDWIWQTPVGTQQMMSLSINAMRSGVYWADEPDMVSTELQTSTWNEEDNRYVRLKQQPKHIDMLMYVMKHYPGNTNNSWTRQFYSDLSHGVSRFDMFLFEPSTSGYTCDYVDGDGGAYPTVRAALNQLGSFEDIIMAGAPAADTAAVAVLYSETSDIWLETAGTYAAALRATYIALRHAQLPVTVLIEEDCSSGRLHYFDVLYVVLPHMTDAAAKGIADWVAAGGTVVVSAGGGMYNEANMTNQGMSTLLGIKETERSAGTQDEFNATVRLIKQDINFVEVLDNVTVPNITAPNTTMVAKGIKSSFTVAPGTQGQTTTTLGTFADGKPAVTVSAVGKGQAYYMGYMPSLSYFAPAIPLRPVDRASVDEGMDHFIPTEFDTTARDLLTLPLAGRMTDPLVVPVASANPLVEVGFVSAEGKGAVLPCVNWAAAPLTGLNVTLYTPFKFTKAVLASGNPVTTTKTSNGTVFTLDLPITAEVIVLR